MYPSLIRANRRIVVPRDAFTPHLSRTYILSRVSRSGKGEGFTLIELLIVIAVVAILSVVVILALNPAELLKQSRDSNRISDMDTLNRAINLFQADSPSGSVGTASTTYLSIADPTATTTAGTDCAGLGLSTSAIPVSWSYHCPASSTLRLANGTGWLPINFSSISSGSPLSRLPLDPISATSTGNYYTYMTAGTGWELTTVFESQKYFWNILTDGGSDTFRYEVGSNLALSGQALGTEILANGNMEAASGGLTTGWSNAVGVGGVITPSDADPANIISGARTQKITIVTGAGGSGLRGSVSGVVCNGWYRARAFYRSNLTGATPFFIGVYDISGGGQGNFFSAIGLAGDGATHMIETIFQVPSNCAGTGYVDVPRTGASNTGTVYADEVSFRRIQ